MTLTYLAAKSKAIPATFQSTDFYPHYRSSLPVSSHASNVQITAFVIFPCLLWGSFVFLEIFLTFVRGCSLNALGNSGPSTSGPYDLLDRSTALCQIGAPHYSGGISCWVPTEACGFPGWQWELAEFLGLYEGQIPCLTWCESWALFPLNFSNGSFSGLK